MKVKNSLVAIALASALAFPLSSHSAVYNVSVSDDYQFNWYKGWSWTATDWTHDNNPNEVSHRYDYDNRDGAYHDAFLNFNLGSLLGLTVDSIVSATLNVNILGIWGSGIVGTVSTGDQVLATTGTGLESFDITASLKSLLDLDTAAVTYSIVHAGQNGFTFGSLEGQDSAFLRVTTQDSTGGDVPEPGTVMLISMGLLALTKRFRGTRL